LIHSRLVLNFVRMGLRLYYFGFITKDWSLGNLVSVPAMRALTTVQPKTL
jgi:hypothetical protein